ncbi:MAG: methionyl-tRNA formyltransferase [Planctomycetota bacterium]
MRLAFFGSPPFAVPVLECVLASRHTVLTLVTQPDRAKGRGRKVETSPLVEHAQAHGIAVLQPETTRDPEFVARLRAFEPDVLLVASYGEIVRRDILELAPHGALNVHASLLPRHRGASPIQAAILAGDRETGVSVQRMVLALDEGDVLLSERTEIGASETSGDLLARLAVLGGGAAVRALDELHAGRAVFTPQDAAHVTYAKKLTKDFGRIDWSKSAADIDRLVRACQPWPGARTTLPDGTELVIQRVDVVELAHGAPPGTLLASKSSLRVATGQGALDLVLVKPAGRAAMDGASFLRGARLAHDARLGV